MPSVSVRATCCIALSLLLASCVEVNVRRTIQPDGSGRQTITLRVPNGQPAVAADVFPGSFRAATVLPVSTRSEPDATVHVANVAFADVTRLRHQAGFFHSAATCQPTHDGRLRYREALGNGFLNSLKRAPDPQRKQAIAAEIHKTKAALANARLTYTIRFPGKILKSNADLVSANEATWVLTADKLFASRTVELTAECRVKPEPPVETASAPLAPRSVEPARRQPTTTAAAPTPHRQAAAPALAPRLEPRRIAAPAARPAARLDGMLLAQAAKTEAAKAEAKPAAQPKPAAKAAAPPAVKPPAAKAQTLDQEPGDDEATGKVKEIFRQALVQLDRKEFENAAKLLQQAIALKPDSAVVANLYRIAVARFLDAALESKNADLKAHAEKLQRIAYRGRIKQLRQPDHVQQLVESLSKGFLPRTFAIEELIVAGDYAVPHIIHYIQANTDASVRAYAGYVLARLGPVAVPAICEAIKSPDPMIRQIVVQALETIGDARAIPALLWAAQEPKAHPLVVESARKAVATLARGTAALNKPASVAFLELAQDYYEKDRKVILPHLYEYLVWRWDPASKQLTSESVPEPMYPYRMAEEACRNALLANPEFELAIPLIVCCYFAQQNFVEDFFTSIKDKKLSPELEKEAELAKPIRQRLNTAPLIAHASGKKFIYAALQRSLRDANTGVAVSCILALRDIADGSALPRPITLEEQARKAKDRPTRRKEGRRRVTWFGPKIDTAAAAPAPPLKPYALPLDGSPLIQALSYTPHRRVRYAAAEALVAISPTHVIRDADKVMGNLSEALAQTADRVALLIDDDESRADQVRGLLRDVGVTPVLARTQRSALDRAAELPPKDLLVINGQLKAMQPAAILASLRTVTSLAATPALVVTAKADLPKLRKQFANESVTFLTIPFDKQSVEHAVDQALKGVAELGGAEQPAFVHSASAARTLAAIRPATSIFKLDDALPSLLRAVASRTHPDTVRVPACNAIEHAASQRAVPYLVNAYKDPKSSKPLRLAILDALGACTASVAKLPDDVLDVLVNAAADDDFAYRQAAARAFGLRGGAGDDVLDVIDYLQGRKKPEPAKKATK